MERRIYRLISLVFIAFLCGGCEDLYGEFGDFTPSAFMRYLRLSETSFEYESSRAHKVQFVVESMDTEWGFSNSNNWFTLSPNKGNTTTEISMSIQENPSGEFLFWMEGIPCCLRVGNINGENGAEITVSENAAAFHAETAAAQYNETDVRYRYIAWS